MIGPSVSKDAWITYASVLLLSFIPVIFLRPGVFWGAALALAGYCGAMAVVTLLCSLGRWRYRRMWIVTGQQIQDTHVFIRVFGGLLDG